MRDRFDMIEGAAGPACRLEGAVHHRVSLGRRAAAPAVPLNRRAAAPAVSLGRRAVTLLATLLLVVAVSAALAPVRALADDATLPDPKATDISTLTSADTELDGARVTFSGEAVGEIINGYDSDHKWVNVTDGSTSIGVYMTTEQAQSIPTFGRYGVKGSTITVAGIYHTACSEEDHAGALDVHADTVEVKEQGGAVSEGLGSKRRWIWSGVLVGISAVLVGVFYYRKRHAAA